MLSNCLIPAPNTPNTIAKSIAKDPYKSGLLSDSLEINFEKKFKFSKFTISVFFNSLTPHKKMYHTLWRLRRCTVTLQTMFLNVNYQDIVQPFARLEHQ